jgi:hypothetical protein
MGKMLSKETMATSTKFDPKAKEDPSQRLIKQENIFHLHLKQTSMMIREGKIKESNFFWTRKLEKP